MKNITGTPENDELFAEGSDEILLGLAGDDYLDGVTGTGNNTLSGGKGNDEIFLNQDDTGLGEAGDDVLYSYGGGYNTLSGGKGNDEIFLNLDDIGFGEAGDDTLYSDGYGNNTLSGGSGNDRIFSDLHDTVLGDDGNDIIYAGRGGSSFTGGAGRDTFWIADVETPEYPNIITDFQPEKDTIRVDLDAVNSFADLHIEQYGSDVIISADYEELVIVENTEVSSLNANNVVTNENLPDNKGNQVRFATFNAALNRDNAGDLITELSTPDSEQGKVIAETIQRNNPDVLLLNEFDYDADGEAIANFLENYLSVSQNGAEPVDYPYVYFAPSNTGIDSGFDLNNDGSIGGGNDALGFGNFPGQFGMVLLSKYPIVESEVRTFQNFLWKDMPDALLPDDPNTVEANDWYSAEELEVVRLSSKSHWDIPLNVNGEVVHVLASHPTPPVFDGEEDRNGKRNHDEIRFWSDYVTPGEGDYIYDDDGGTGGLAPGESFVIMGDQNADPFDGDSTDNAINQLLDNPLVNTSVTPDSEGGVDAASRQGGANDTHVGNPAFDTADFADSSPGNLRVDYVLPSQNLEIQDAGVFWPESDDPQFELVGDFPFPGSDHRLVYTDVEITGETPAPRNQERKTVTGVEFLGKVSFPTGSVFEGTEVGGLSGITYDEKNQVYYSLADDRGNRDENLPDGVSPNEPARFYELTIDLEDGTLDDGDIAFTDVTTLVDENGNPFGAGEIDPEGITLTKDGNLYISSEGDANNLVDPFVNQFSLDGEQLSTLPVPEKFLPTADQSKGIRNNKAFESLTITPDQRYLYTAVENALYQDGPAADLENQSLARIIKYDLATGEPVEEFVYVVDEVPEVPEPADGFSDNGLVELLAIDNNGTLLALERSFSVGKGNTVKLYEVRTQGALDVSNTDDLFNETDNVPFEIDPAVDKRLLVDFADLGITPDNLEGITLGPELEDGRQSLIVVSDNNFNDTQETQFITLALDLETTPAVTPKTETPEVVNIENSDTGIPGDADDPAIWVNPDNSGESLVIGTLKEGGLVTFNLQGEVQQTIAPENFGDYSYNNVDILYGFQLGNETVDLAIASDRENDTLAVFKIDPQTQQLTDITAEGILDTIFGIDDGEKTAYGLANYKSPVTGKSYTFVTQADGNQVAQLELKDNGDGTVDAEIVRIIDLPVPTGDAEDSQAEGLVVDQELGFLYVAMEEEVGILKFSAEVNGGNDYSVIQPIDGDELVPDIEGLSIYYGDDGTGYLLASSQGDSSYAVFSREGNNEYLGSFVVGDNGEIDQANETDGLDIINVPLGDEYPNGLLVVQDGANDPQKVVEDEEELENASTNFKFIDPKELTTALPAIELDPTSYDPRNPESLVNGGNQDQKTVTGVEFLGKVSFPTGSVFEGTEVGGLSGITYDEKNQVYYSLADDRGNRDENLPDGVSPNEPARFYELTIDLEDGTLDDGDIAFTDVTTLVDENGNPFGAGEIDPEGITLTEDGNLYISSEGDANNLVDPFVNQFSLDGEQLSSLPVPEKFLPTADQSQGIRNNQAFESLTITPDQRYLYTAVENALYQDGPAAGLENQSLARIIKYDLATGEPVEEFVYVIDEVAEAPEPADGFKVNGLVELLAIDNSGTLLALERSFSVGKGNTVKLYEVRTQDALDVSDTDDLFNEADNTSFNIDHAVDKRLLVDFADLGITPDNLEGITLGPELEDGRQSLIVVSDNNFNDTQETQFITLALDLETTPVEPDPVTPDPVTPDPVTPDPVAPEITVDDQNVFTVTGTTNLKAQLTANNSSTSNEVGFFIVEDSNGTITDSQGNSLTPSDGDAYLKAALEQSEVLFSTVPENPNDYNPVDISRILEGVGNENLVFYFIEDGTTDGVINGSIPTSQVSLGSDFNSNAFTGLTTTDLGNGSYSLAWDNNELVLTVSTTDESAPIGNNLQGGNSGELIDLTNVSSQVTAEFSVYRDALYNNNVYFYKVDNGDGVIGDINPANSNPEDYLQAAINNIVKDAVTGEVVELTGSNQGITTTQAVVEAGSIIAPMIVIDGTLSQLTDGDASNDPEFYVPYLGSNTDGVDHIRLLADNTFGFEDLPFGGDWDYNDMIVAMDFKV